MMELCYTLFFLSFSFFFLLYLHRLQLALVFLAERGLIPRGQAVERMGMSKLCSTRYLSS